MQTDEKKLAEKHFEAANSRAATATKIAFASLVALVLLWRGNLEPLVPMLNKAVLAAQSVRHSTANLGALKASPPSNNRKERLQELSLQRDADRSALAEQLRTTRVEFDIPGFKKFTVPLRFAALVLNALFLVMLLYLTQVRTQISRLLGRGARLLQQSSANQTLGRPELVFFIPWWIAPLPQVQGAVIKPDEFSKLIEWDSKSRLNFALAIVFLILLCAVQIRLCLIGLMSAYALSAQVDSPFVALAASVLSALLTIITIGCAVYWLLPRRVPDVLNDPPIRITRRQLLVGAGGGVLGLAAAYSLAAFFPRALVGAIRSPRFRRKKKEPAAAVAMSPGFYMNQRSKVVHYVWNPQPNKGELDPAGANMMVGLRLPKARWPKPANFTRVDENNAVKAFGARASAAPSPAKSRTPLNSKPEHVTIAAEPRIAELAAREAWQAGRRDHAQEILLRVVAVDLERLKAEQLAASRQQLVPRLRPNWRVYYLLARYAIVSRSEKIIADVVGGINNAALTPTFAHAVKAWTDSNSKWRRQLVRRS